MTSQENIQNLAKLMGVSESDIVCFAQSVAGSIEKDGADQAFIQSNEQGRQDITGAYAKHAVKKHEEFATAYMTKGREAFQAAIYKELTGEPLTIADFN